MTVEKKGGGKLLLTTKKGFLSTSSSKKSESQREKKRREFHIPGSTEKISICVCPVNGGRGRGNTKLPITWEGFMVSLQKQKAGQSPRKKEKWGNVESNPIATTLNASITLGKELPELRNPICQYSHMCGGRQQKKDAATWEVGKV